LLPFIRRQQAKIATVNPYVSGIVDRFRAGPIEASDSPLHCFRPPAPGVGAGLQRGSGKRSAVRAGIGARRRL